MDSKLNNLPFQLSSFIGREQEISDAKRLLNTSRLVTLTGAGGCGKTRLALQVATDLLTTFADGTWLVEFAPLADSALVPQAVASALEVHEQPGRSLVEVISERLRDKHLLLVLDNCEHLIMACAQLAETLLQTCPTIRILATSREALNLAGEITLRVPSLSVPASSASSSELEQYESIRLFFERAAAVQTNFALTDKNAAAIAQVCQRLDGIPLALELAAALVAVLSVEQMAARLDDLFPLLTSGRRTALPRHQTMQAALDWSHALLSEPEQVLFRRLSVLAGRWSLEAAEFVCQDARENLKVFGLLTQLINKSLVQLETREAETRYRLLEPVRQYARLKLAAAGEENDVRDRHLEFFVALAEAIGLKNHGSQEVMWMDRLETEHDNLRAALNWSLESSQSVSGLRLAGALGEFWDTHAHVSEGRMRLTALLAKPDAVQPTTARAVALRVAGFLAFVQRDVVAGRSCLEESLSIANALRDEHLVAEVLLNLGSIAYAEGNFDEARTHFDKTLTIRRELEDKPAVAEALAHVGLVALHDRSYERAQRLFEESLTFLRGVNDSGKGAYVCLRMGQAALHLGDYQKADSLCRESLSLSLAMAKEPYILGGIALSGALSAARGHKLRAVRLYAAVENLLASKHVQLRPYDDEEYQANVMAIQTELDPATYAQAWREGVQLTLEAAIREAERITPEPSLPATSTSNVPLVNAKVPGPLSDLSRVVDARASAGLHVYALGGARVMLGTRALTDDDWRYSKSRELLYFLLSHASATKEQVGLAFWPEQSPAQLRNLFGVVMHDLRRALGRSSDWVIFKDSHYAFNRARDYWFDVEAFESKLAQAQMLLQASSPEQREAILTLQDAVKLYSGDFLHDFTDGDWHLLRREELRRKHLEALLTLGQLLLSDKQYSEATQVYQRAISQDSYLEVAHRELMRCYARQGERGQALRQYRTLLDVMRDELSAPPAPETTALFERIRRGEDV